MPEINTIDFEFVFAAASFEDNMTIFFLLLVVFIIYLIMMIWAIIKDRKDQAAVKKLGSM